ncbi:hypothetical protein LA080_009796 [Diaporthe eres]|nr:hypothetical protein LA080_009796 [Diaporthe eres]
MPVTHTDKEALKEDTSQVYRQSFASGSSFYQRMFSRSVHLLVQHLQNPATSAVQPERPDFQMASPTPTQDITTVYVTRNILGDCCRAVEKPAFERLGLLLARDFMSCWVYQRLFCHTRVEYGLENAIRDGRERNGGWLLSDKSQHDSKRLYLSRHSTAVFSYDLQHKPEFNFKQFYLSRSIIWCRYWWGPTVSYRKQGGYEGVSELPSFERSLELPGLRDPIFDEVLDPEVLREALENVVKRPGWERLGGRLKRTSVVIP